MPQPFDYKKENVLILDSQLETGKGLRDLLGDLGLSAGFISNGKEALHELRHQNYTFLIADITIPQLNALQLIKTVKKEAPRINIIAITGHNKDYSLMDVIDAGASDFITKPFEIDEMRAKINRILIERETRDELARLSITDDLTGLFNQRHFYDRLRQEIGRTNRLSHPLSLILLDLDNFKAYNDRYGHLAGDRMLTKCGKIIRSNIRANVDIAFRYGGDEFAVILVEADSDIARNISLRLQKGFEESGTVTASIGVTTYSKGMDVNDLVEGADRNLYLEKNEGS